MTTRPDIRKRENGKGFPEMIARMEALEAKVDAIRTEMDAGKPYEVRPKTRVEPQPSQEALEAAKIAFDNEQARIRAAVHAGMNPDKVV